MAGLSWALFLGVTAVIGWMAEQLLRSVAHMAQAEQRKQFAERIAESERKYRIVADNTFAWEYWIDPQERFYYSSPSCESITGYSPAEFEADPDLLLKVIHPDDRAVYLAHRGTLPRQGCASDSTEFRIVRRDGAVRWIGHSCLPVYAENGNYLGIRASNRDITRNKEAEERIVRLNKELQSANAELKQRAAEVETERERWQGVVEGIADEVWISDTEGKISLINLPETTAMELDPFTNKSLGEIYDELDILNPDGQPRPYLDTPLLRALKGEIVRGQEMMRHRKTGPNTMAAI